MQEIVLNNGVKIKSPGFGTWTLDDATAEDVVLNFGRYLVPWEKVQEFMTYEEAEAFRNRLIEESK